MPVHDEGRTRRPIDNAPANGLQVPNDPAAGGTLTPGRIGHVLPRTPIALRDFHFLHPRHATPLRHRFGASTANGVGAGDEVLAGFLFAQKPVSDGFDQGPHIVTGNRSPAESFELGYVQGNVPGVCHHSFRMHRFNGYRTLVLDRE